MRLWQDRSRDRRGAVHGARGEGAYRLGEWPEGRYAPVPAQPCGIGRGTATDGGSHAARSLAACGERTADHVTGDHATGPSRARKDGWAAARAARCPSSAALAVACPGLGVTPCIEPESALPRRSRRGLRDASATEGKKRVGLLPSPDLWVECLTYLVCFVKGATFGLAWQGEIALRFGGGSLCPMLRYLLPLVALIPATASAETLYVRAGRLVDPEAGKVLTGQVLTVEDGRVVSVQGDGPLPQGAKVVDWSGFTVLPGLIDCHVHLADVEQSNNVAEPLLHSAMEIGFISARNAKKTLLAGFTTVHDVGSFRAYADVELRNAINRGDVPGPRVSAVGAYVTIPGGGGEVTGFAPDVTVPADMRAGVVNDAADVTQIGRAHV